jgi:hypothetical protein
MDWIEGLANELGLEPLSSHEVDHVLASSRGVAHRIERRVTPLAMYLMGVEVGRQMASGRTRDDALEDAVHTVLLRLPPEDSPPVEEA